ncbi:helix-turn-helix domain-containing protein [Nocardia sp. IBHARD005]|uniref:helix-turn-helix domain-containing protein n=1 Tax=Nocardia sp. IBHARD005 TaxID=3457765 RepID=UPI004058ABE7
MTEGEARTLGALVDGALTADGIAKRTQMSRSQVGEHLRHLAMIGFVTGNTATPRLWGMTGLAQEWSRQSVGRCALGIQA